jgi:hypothetical protein
LVRQEVGDKFTMAQSLEDLAVLAGHQGQTGRAIRLLGAAEALWKTLGFSPPAADATLYQPTMAAGRAALGEAAVAAAWAEGRSMSIEQAVEYAMAAD